jgi:hypothetical protein
VYGSSLPIRVIDVRLIAAPCAPVKVEGPGVSGNGFSATLIIAFELV